MYINKMYINKIVLDNSRLSKDDDFPSTLSSKTVVSFLREQEIPAWSRVATKVSCAQPLAWLRKNPPLPPKASPRR